MASVNGASPVMAIVEQLSAQDCHMRSVHPFAIGALIDLSIAIHGVPAVPLQGRIVSCKQSGARFAYVVSLQGTAAEGEAITRIVEASRSRKRAHAPDVATTDGLTRAAVRVPVDFDVRYALLGASPRSARAINISTGGIHLNTEDEIAVGATIELEIPLDGRRVNVRGRVVAHQEMTPNYNVAFFDVSHEARDLIARFVSKFTE